MADGEGFEPPEGLPLQRFSRPPHSTALPTIRNFTPVGLSTYGFGVSHDTVMLTLHFADARSQDTHASTHSANHPKLYFRRSLNLRFWALLCQRDVFYIIFYGLQTQKFPILQKTSIMTATSPLSANPPI